MRHLKIGTAFAALLGLTMLLGCGDDNDGTTGPHNHVLESVQVEPASPSLTEGEAVQLEATPTCVAGEPLDVPVTWSSGDEAVATVDASGLVTGVYEGQVDISAEASYEGTTMAGTAGLTVERGGTTITTSGGVVSYGSGDVVLEVPSGALASDTRIAIDPSSPDVAAEKPDMALGSAYHFRPEGLQFQTAARLTIRYSDDDLPDGANADRLRLFHRTESGWEELFDSDVDTGARTVSGDITGFSHYGVGESGRPAVDIITVGGASEEPIPIGGTVQLTATLRDADGNLLEHRRVEWSSGDEAVATVDQDGLVTGVARGVADIFATSEGVSGSAQVRVSGETGDDDDHEEGGNNMSWPVVFADGVGFTGAPASEDPGVRPTPESGITVDTLPFFWEENVADYGEYYLQQGDNVWRAEYIDGSEAQQPYVAEAYWGDNITVREWSATRPIRVEVALSATEVGTLEGYVMTYLYGQGPSEMQGTDGTTSEFVPLIYSPGATFIVEEIDGLGGSVIGTVDEGPISTEVNIAGRIIYGHQLKFDALGYGEGYYRLRFILAEGARVNLTSVGNAGDELTFEPVVVNSKETAIDIHVTP